MREATVAVVGAGPAGLVAARHLAAAGASVTVFERQASVGGRVRSTRQESFVVDRGFQVLLTAYPAARRELDYDALDLRTFAPGATICRENSRAVLSDPFRDPRSLVETALTPEIALGDKLRTLWLRRDLAATPVENVFAGPDTTIERYLADRGFSREFVERFAAPFYGGITLDRSLSTSKRVFEFTFKMLAEGETAVPAAGMGAITDQLAARAREAGATVRTEAPVEAVDADADGATVRLPTEAVDADAAVVATDPPTARELTGVASIPTAARACVTQYYATEGPGLGARIHLNAGGTDPNHVVDLSAVAPEYAPGDQRLLCAVFLGERSESDADLASLTRDALASWYPERQVTDLAVVATRRTPFAQFAQPPGVHDDLPGVTAPEGRCYLAGEVTSTSSLNGALQSGRQAAAAVSHEF